MMNDEFDEAKRLASEIVGKHAAKWIESGAVDFQQVCLLNESVTEALREKDRQLADLRLENAALATAQPGTEQNLLFQVRNLQAELEARDKQISALLETNVGISGKFNSVSFESCDNKQD